VPDVVLRPEAGTGRGAPISEAALPGHLQGEGEAMEGDNAGEVLPGPKPVDAALLELKKMAGGVARPATAAPQGAARPHAKAQ
ncbi:MAG: peptidase S41, partial [Thermomonas sp.]|nr:peptidase S41 [Thermomonas sp.]